MNNLQKLQKGQKLIADLVTKCWEDEKFKNQLLNDSKKTVNEFTDNKFSLPENMVLKVEDQTNKNLIFLNIPKKPNFDSIQLSDEELESIAGGDFLLGVAGSLLAAAIWDTASGFYDAATL